MRTPHFGAARSAAASNHARRRRLHPALVTVGLAVASAAALAITVGPGRASVALVGGATLGGLPAAPGRLSRRWPLAVAAAVAVVVAVVVAAGEDPGPGLTLVGALAGALVALALAGLLGVRWWTWTGAWAVAAAAAVAALLVVPEGGLHRAAVVALAAALLVAVARTMSKLALRLVAVAVLATGIVALAWVGDRAEAPGPSRADRAEAAAVLAAFADEADSLRGELPCGRARERVPDLRLCDGLRAVEADARDADADAGPAAVIPLGDRLDRLRAEVAVRLLPTDVEPEARVELARDQAQADGGADAAARAEAAEVAPTRPRAVHQLVADGVDEVVADTFGGLVGEGTVARLGGAGWALLGALLLLGYRRLEVINNRRYGGPVVVAEVVAAAGEPAGPELTALVRNRVAELDLRDPAPVPGAGAGAKPTADIVGGLGADPAPGGRLASALAAVRHALLPAPGVTVVPAYAQVPGRPGDPDDDRRDDRRDEGEGPGAGQDGPGPDEHVMSVRIVTPDRRRTLRAASFRRATPEAAARAAADFAVCDALGRSALTPSWARWWSEDGAALAAYQAVVADTGRNGPRLSLHEQVDLLEAARAASPGTGLALVELGHRYELDERPLDALRSHLVTRSLHPRFAPARYRTAASLSMLAAPGRLDEHWLDPDRSDDRHQVADLLVDGGLVERATRSRLWDVVEPRCPDDIEERREWLAQPEPSPGTRRDILKVFLLVARAELVDLEKATGYPALVAGSLRQSERHVWLQLLAAPGLRRDALERYRSARWIAELRLALIPAQPGTEAARELQRRVEAMASRRAVGTIALYNAACFTSVLAERSPAKGDERAELQDRAVRYLARLVRRGRGPVPSSGWLTTDPDLLSLQAVPAFNDLVRRLADDEERQSAITAATPQ